MVKTMNHVERAAEKSSSNPMNRISAWLTFEYHEKNYFCCCGLVHVKAGSYLLCVGNLAAAISHLVITVYIDFTQVLTIYTALDAVIIVTSILCLYGLVSKQHYYLEPAMLSLAFGVALLLVAGLGYSVVIVFGDMRNVNKLIGPVQEWKLSETVTFLLCWSMVFIFIIAACITAFEYKILQSCHQWIRVDRVMARSHVCQSARSRSHSGSTPRKTNQPEINQSNNESIKCKTEVATTSDANHSSSSHDVQTRQETIVTHQSVHLTVP